MKEFFSKSGGLLFVIALLLTILLGTSSVILQGSVDPITNVVGIVTSPVRQTVSAVSIFGENVYDFVANYEQLEIDVAALRIQVAEMEEIVREGDDALRENEQLRELLGLQAKRRDFVFESARVTARSFTGWEAMITLDKGRNADVAEGDCVVTEAGHLVGIVTELGETWCHVSTIISTNTQIGGYSPRTDSAGVLEGEFSLVAQGQLRLSYLGQDATLVAGDQVLTSGMGDQYPEGLTVGKIQAVFDEPSGMSRYAIIQPDVDLQSLIQVFVIKDYEIVN